MTDEAINHWDNASDLKETFVYDLTGNRTKLTRDLGNNATNDQVITYLYDVNDRLTSEAIDDLVNNANDATTTYGYSQTQQISKTVAAGAQTRSKQLFTYNLQGRMASVVNEGYTTGTLSSRTRSTYQYDSGSYRIGVVNATDNALNNTYTTTSSIAFLADAHNHTGYMQTIREITVNADGTSKTIDYTFGNDEISQRTVTRNAANGVTSDKTLVFGHDGHGSVTILFDLSSTAFRAIEALATYSAYGVLLATHNNIAGVHASNFTHQTSLGYSGELWDAASQQQYLRARYYNPANGRFNRLDPFHGNMQDPQSLHKYAYVHGEPVQGVDPTGMFNIGGMLSSISIGIGMLGSFATVAGAAPEVTAIFGILTWLSIQSNFYELFFGLDAGTGESLSAPRRAMAGVFLLFDLGGSGQVKRVFPKNIPLDEIARFASKLHLEHAADAPATKEAIAAALKFSEEIAERGLTVGGKGAMGADILAETVDGKLIAREVSVFQGR